jgi:hypothetical protein
MTLEVIAKPLHDVKWRINMQSEHWEIIAHVSGEIQAEILRGLLEAQGIPVTLNQEGAGRAYGISMGPMGEVQLMVPSRYSQHARQVLADYEAGLFETPEDEPSDDQENTQDEGED